MQTESLQPKPKGSGVFEGVTAYHWLVVIVASLGWLFDCMDQRLFVLARESALKELLQNDAAALLELRKYIGYATTSMILGWATGGIIFGMMSDRIGRVKTMAITLLAYSLFTGLSGFSHNWVDFTIYRFLVGLGVGGMFGAATTLVAESVPREAVAKAKRLARKRGVSVSALFEQWSQSMAEAEGRPSLGVRLRGRWKAGIEEKGDPRLDYLLEKHGGQ